MKKWNSKIRKKSNQWKCRKNTLMYSKTIRIFTSSLTPISISDTNTTPENYITADSTIEIEKKKWLSHTLCCYTYQIPWPINRCYEIFGNKNKKEQKTKHVKVVAGRSLRIQLGNHSYTQWRWRWCCFQRQKKRIWKKKKKRKYETTKQQQTTASFFF